MTKNQKARSNSVWTSDPAANGKPLPSSRSPLRIGLVGATLFLATAIGAHSQSDAKALRAHPEPTVSTKTYAPASYLASPGLECKLYPESAPSKTITVFSDHDGYVRFHAVRTTSSDPVQSLNLDCADSAGKAYSYSVDLTSDETFAPHPLNLANEPGKDRPALTGDPLSYSESELIQAGYAPRPDPNDKAAYGRWLEAAKLPGRMLYAKRPTRFSATVTTTTAEPWSGAALGGSPNYVSTEATFNVPTLLPGADETLGTESAIWNGLGGFGTGSGLIQGGVGISTTFLAASYNTWREYCCGDPDSNGYGGNFTPNPGDSIYSVEWYCDAKGNININGGYGCSHLHDLTSGAIFDCSSATGSPCWSVKALTQCSVKKVTNCMTLGTNAEFIIENQSGQLTPKETQWTPFSGTVTIAGSAYSSKTGSYSQTISSDSQVYKIEDFENESSHMVVTLGKTNQTEFNVNQFQRVSGTADYATFAQSIGVGPNADGTTIGDAWMLGETANAEGNYQVYQLQGTSWVKQPGAGTHIAVGPEGYPWIITNGGAIYYWNGSAFELAPGNGCATWISVGPNAFGSKYGDPWIIGCNGGAGRNGNIFQLQGSTWVNRAGSGGANKIAVSPEGEPWVIDAAGGIFYWNGSSFVGLSIGGCATDIAVASKNVRTAGPNGDVWILGCSLDGSSYHIYELLLGTTWGELSGTGNQISLSPFGGVPWVIGSVGQIYE